MSDKPSSTSDYSYFKHAAWNRDLLFNHLDLTNITAVLQDWGGILGLRLAAQHSDRFSRLVIANTVLPTGGMLDADTEAVTEGFFAWKDYVYHGGLQGPGAIGKLISRGAMGPSAGPENKLSTEEIRGYDAPFPDDMPELRAGVQVFPELVPTPPSDSTGRHQVFGSVLNTMLWNVFKAWDKPVLLAFADGDPVLGAGATVWKKYCPGARGIKHPKIQGGHFLQDGGGEQLVREVINFMQQHNDQRTTSKL